MGLRLSGSNALAYQGVQAPQPPNFLIRERNPTATDAISLNQGTLWLNWNRLSPRASVCWMLADKQQNVFTWLPLGGPGSSSTAVFTYSTPGTYTYTPTAHISYIQVECVGGGAASPTYSAASTSFSVGGSGGGYCKQIFNHTSITSPITVTVGAGGVSSNSTSTNNNGGSSSFGSLMTANGGIATSLSGINPGGTATGGFINIPGGSSGASQSINIVVDSGVDTFGFTGSGGGSFYGTGGINTNSSGPASIFSRAGNAGTGYGAGAGGGCGGNNGGPAVTVVGANGTSGIVIITEYLS